MIRNQDAAVLSGLGVYGSDGSKIGTVGQVWDIGGEPAWASVKTGMFGMKETLVPLQGAELKGDHVLVPFDKAQVKDAPNIDASSDDPLEDDEVIRLYDYYGMTFVGGGASTAQAGPSGGYRAEDVIEERASTDDAMTRSEERLNVGKRREQVGVARLHKYVVTEEQQVSVPVSHEEVRVEREPITTENRDAAYAGPDITEAEHDVTLYAERPVVDKEAVPVERVRMGKETVTEQQTVGGQVRKERIEAETPEDEHRDLD